MSLDLFSARVASRAGVYACIVEMNLFDARMFFLGGFQRLGGKKDTVPVFPGTPMDCKNGDAHISPFISRVLYVWKENGAPDKAIIFLERRRYP
jgi:hypothetical protein